jgi:hypothetical protein
VPNINEAFPSKYLKASDLKGAGRTVTITHVEFEEVGREREKKAVVYFQGKDKGLVLNKTNCNKIIQIAASALTEEWAGVPVELYPTETEFGGETVECIRVRQPRAVRPAAPPPPPVQQPVDTFTSDDDVPF